MPFLTRSVPRSTEDTVPRSGVTDTGRGALLAFGKSMRGADDLYVGIQGSTAAQPHPGRSGKAYATIGEVATRNEFGLGVPERSFLRAWFDLNKSRIRREIADACKEALRPTRNGRPKRNKEQAMRDLGRRYVAEVRAWILDGVPPPNAPSTIARKGSDTPLVDTGLMMRSISYLLRSIDGEEHGAVDGAVR